MSLLCANCGREIYVAPWVFWCNRCYHDWKEDILAKKPWTRYLRNLEKRRREAEKSRWEAGYSEVFLQDNDIAVINGTNRIIKVYNREV